MRLVGNYAVEKKFVLEVNDGSTVALEQSDCERDLGMMMDNELKFGQQVDVVVLKANRHLGLIKRSFIHLPKNPWLRPIFEYANVTYMACVIQGGH